MPLTMWNFVGLKFDSGWQLGTLVLLLHYKPGSKKRSKFLTVTYLNYHYSSLAMMLYYCAVDLCPYQSLYPDLLCRSVASRYPTVPNQRKKMIIFIVNSQNIDLF